LQPLGAAADNMPKVELIEGVAEPNAALMREGRYAVLHLWCGAAKWARLREWPIDRWRDVARWLNEKGILVLLTGGREDGPKSENFISQCAWPDMRVKNIGGLSFRELIPALSGSLLTVSVDTCMTHLSAALDIPTLSLHGPSSSSRWGPVGRRAESIDSALPGCGYMNWGADSDRKRAKLKCMEAISSDEVITKMGTMLEEGESG